MASIEKDPASGRYRIRFRFQGRQYQRSLRTKTTAEAQGALVRVEDTLRMIHRGFVEVPVDADAGLFILSDGRVANHAKAPMRKPTLGKLFERYFEEIATVSKEESTIQGERYHEKHLLRHLGASTWTSRTGPRFEHLRRSTRSLRQARH